MEQDAGWVELLAGEAPTVLARGRAIVTYAPMPHGDASNAQRGQLVELPGAWHGRLESVKLAEGVRALERGPHRVRFEANGEMLFVVIEGWEELSDGTGRVVLRGIDTEVPAVLLELGGE